MSEKRTANETATAAEWVKVADLRPWLSNPRKNDRAVDGVAESIKAFGFGAPVLARRANGEIIAGHTRIKAAAKLGLDVVPVRYLDLDEAKAHLLAIADNKLNEAAAWDEAVLGAVMADLKAKGESLEVTGFAEHELHKLLAEENGSALNGSAAVKSEPDRLREKWETALGQAWVIPSLTVSGGVHRIVCGSSTDNAVVTCLMATERADMMWTDPPYGVSYEGKTPDALTIENDKLSSADLRQFLIDCFQAANDAALRASSAWYICHPAGEISLQFRLAVDAVGWIYRQGLVWVKDAMVLGRSDYHYKHEPIIFGYTPGKGRKGRGSSGWYGSNAETSVFDVDRPTRSELHPTSKPVELVARMLRNSSPEGGMVYEPFSGSGSTMVACESASRLCRAIELDPKYVAVALERMSEMGCEPVLVRS